MVRRTRSLAASCAKSSNAIAATAAKSGDMKFLAVFSALPASLGLGSRWPTKRKIEGAASRSGHR